MRGSNWFFVDVEARGTSPVTGIMTEFGVVHYTSRRTFHGQLWEGKPDPANPAVPIVGDWLDSPRNVANALVAWMYKCSHERAVMWSDNPAYDFMWIAGMFDAAGVENPFGHSARRISDYYAGLQGDVRKTQDWKRYRKTPHDHNPVNDAMGNVEAMIEILSGRCD